MLPACPVMGEGMAPMMAAPEAVSALATSPRVRRWMSGSRIMPFAREASTRPASNWGLASTTNRGHRAQPPPWSATGWSEPAR